jgi:hypothetical protein
MCSSFQFTRTYTRIRNTPSNLLKHKLLFLFPNDFVYICYVECESYCVLGTPNKETMRDLIACVTCAFDDLTVSLKKTNNNPPPPSSP